MWLKKFCRVLVCMVVVSCLVITAWAADSAVYLEVLKYDTPTKFETEDLNRVVSSRVSGSFSTTISANSIVVIGKSFSLEAGETVTINSTYSPVAASMDFGLVAPNGSFYYLNVTNGSIHKTIRVNQHGYYTLAIRNNSLHTISVVGLVNY